MSESNAVRLEPKPGFLLKLLHVLIAAAIGNLLFAGGALLMGIDSRLACLGGLVIVLISPIIIFLLVIRQMSSNADARRALRSCWLVVMFMAPISSWLCELLYWHFGKVGVVLAFALVLPLISVLALLWCVGALRPSGLWGRCQRPMGLFILGLILFWAANGFQLATISLNWDIVAIPGLKPDSWPATISRSLTAFLPTTLLLVFFARVVVNLGRGEARVQAEKTDGASAPS